MLCAYVTAIEMQTAVLQSRSITASVVFKAREYTRPLDLELHNISGLTGNKDTAALPSMIHGRELSIDH
jgi:hypothetical protein